MLLSVWKECSSTAQIYQMLLQRSFSSSVTTAIFFLHSSSHTSIFCCIKYKVFIFTCNFLNSLFLSYHILFLAHSHTFHLSIPKSQIPRFKEVPLWFPSLGASCFRKILCKQPGFSDNLPFKTFLKLCFWKTWWELGHLCAAHGSVPTQHSCGDSLFSPVYMPLSHVSFTLTRKAFWNIGHLLCVKWEVLHTIDLSVVNMTILITILVNVLERYGPMQSLLFLVQGAKYFRDNSYILMYFFQPIELCFNSTSTGEQGEPRPSHYRGFSM